MFLGLTRKDNPWQGVLANTPDLFCNGPLALSIAEKLDTMDRNALIRDWTTLHQPKATK